MTDKPIMMSDTGRVTLILAGTREEPTDAPASAPVPDPEVQATYGSSLPHEAPHTLRGFFADLKKRQGIPVVPSARVRQADPKGVKSSYTIYRIAEAG